MAKSKKKKKTPQPSPKRDYEVTKTFFDKFSVIARKTLQLMDLDPALYDRFTKKQKLEMMRTKFAPPHFEAKPGHQVPRHYVRVIQKMSMQYMEHMYIGNPDLGLSYYDYLTMGSQFGTHMSATCEEKQYCEQAEVYKTIAEQVNIYEDFGDHSLMMPYFQYLRLLLDHLSQFNYRMYGFDIVFKQTNNRIMLAAFIQITSVECEKKSFIFQDKKRPAFRLLMGSFMKPEVTYINTLHSKVIKNSTSNKLLGLYVQSHALLRMKERLDTLNVYEKNLYLMTSVVLNDVVKLETGRSAFEMHDLNSNIIAYLPFIVQDECVIVLTVLPVTNPATPIGKKLCQTLGVSKAELEICGMDKLSYFINTDFDKIPKLKHALEVNNLTYLTEIQSLIEPMKKTQRTAGISASIFQTERTHEEVLSEIEEKY
jgi:hypothetical protein